MKTSVSLTHKVPIYSLIEFNKLAEIQKEEEVSVLIVYKVYLFKMR